MPKSRGSSIAGIGSGSGSGSENLNGGTRIGVGGGSGSSIDELAGRLLDRINQERTVDVLSWSGTRDHMENLRVTINPDNPNTATVDSGSGRQYIVDHVEDTCTCPDHRIRRRRCRHIDAVHQAMGEISRISAPEGPLNIEREVETRQFADALEEEQRSEIQNILEDDNFFYEDNEEEFQRAIAQAASEPLVYEYENVLNGSRNTFGIEIEFVGGNADAIARELHSLGICGYDRRVRYHSPGIPGKWKLEEDGSVVSGNGGGELVSPILQDIPETWRTIEKICEVAKRHGASIDGHCGGHIHMSMAPLDTARQRWKRFFKAIAANEDVLYRLAGGSIGQIRAGHTGYARPFAERAALNTHGRFVMDSESDIRDLARRTSEETKYYGVNLKNIYQPDKPNTVEFRYFNSSLEPAQLQANIKIANGILVASEKARIRSQDTSEAMRRRGQILNGQNVSPTGRVDRSNHNAIKKFIDLFFTRKKDKDCALKVYAKNTWRD